MLLGIDINNTLITDIKMYEHNIVVGSGPY